MRVRRFLLLLVIKTPQHRFTRSSHDALFLGNSGDQELF